MKVSEIKQLSDVELVHRALAIERELVRDRFSHSMGKLENTASLRSMRKDIARLKTEARAREIAQGLAKEGLFQQHRGSFVAGEAVEGVNAVSEGGFLKGIVDKIEATE